MKEIYAALEREKIIAILRGFSRTEADRTTEALITGGIRLLEVTLNTEGAPDMIAAWREDYKNEAVYIGAGTVLNLEQAKQAVEAGAQFIVSPNFDIEVLDYGSKHGVPVWPGVMTPTEIVKAWQAGAQAVKVFPMESLGLKYLKEIQGPLSHIPMIATGGVNLKNIQAFLETGAAAVGMGGSLADKSLIQAGKYQELTKRAEEFVRIVKG